MSMKKLFIYLIGFSLIGCVLTEESYSNKEFIIKLPGRFKIEVLKGESQIILEKDSFKIVEVKFSEVRGGKTYLFGREIKDVGNGYKVKRLSLINNGIIVKRISINDILRLPTETIDSFKVYILPY